MNIIKLIPLMLMLMLMLNVVAATSTINYSISGTPAGTYQLESGIFIDDFVPTLTGARGLTSGEQIPLVGDLDNDGTSEIVVIDDSTIVIYQNKELDIITSYSLGVTDVEKSNMMLFDIDGDTFLEILIANGDDEVDLFILNFNQSTITNSSLNALISSADHANGGDISINCRDTNDCLVAWASDETPGSSRTVEAKWFNSTTFGSKANVDTTQPGSAKFCFTTTRGMMAVDYDGDTVKEYILANAEDDPAGDLDITISEIEVTITTTTSSKIVDNFDTDATVAGENDCNTFDKKFTAPLAFDATAGHPNLEVILGYNKDDEEFNIQTWKNTGATLNNYPSGIFDGDGSIISNVFIANVDDDAGGEVDFCVFGHNPTASDFELEMVCGSEQKTIDNLQQIFQSSFDAPFNLSETAEHWSVIAHSSDQNNNPTGLSEIVTPYGIFSTEQNLITFSDLVLESEIPQPNGAVVMIDAEQFGSDDMIILTSTNLYYYDDGQSNGDAGISEVFFNPCPIGTTIKVNESMLVTVDVTDTNPALLGPDQVSASIIMYDGDSNEFRLDSTNRTADTSTQTATIEFSIPLNKTITQGTMTVIGRDSFNQVEDTEVFTFTVANNGIETDDQTCTQSFVVEESELTAEQTAEAAFIEDNSLTSALDETSTILFGGTPSSFSRGILWLLVMILAAWGIWNAGTPSSHTFGMIILLEILLLVLGTKLQFIGTGVLVSIVVLGLISVVMVFWNRMFASNTNG